MLPVEHNGDGFHYIVSYKRLEPNTLRRASEVVTRVTDWRQSQFVDDDVGTYAEYLVTVQAANSVGEAPQSSVERRIGHSGEDGMHIAAFIRLIMPTVSLVLSCNEHIRQSFLCGPPLGGRITR